MKRWLLQHMGPLIFGGVGLVFMAVGSGLLWGSGAAARQADEVAGWPLVTAAQWPQLAAGQTVAIEGRISERNPVAAEGLVAFVARQYLGVKCSNDNSNDCRPAWAEVQRVTPALWLDAPGGRVQLANTDYTLANPPEVRQTTPQLVAGQTVEYRGFRPGSPVFTGGVINQADGVTLRATFLAGGDRAAYLATQHGAADTLLTIGIVLAAFGLAFASIGLAWGYLS